MKIKMYITWIKYVLKYFLAIIISPLFIFNSKYKNLWLISERGIDARDNAYCLFQYICKNHPNINVRYIISKNSADREKVLKTGSIIEYGKLEHYIALVLSKIKISTHIMGYTTDLYFFTKLDKLGLIFGKKVFLQHGITKDDMDFMHYHNTKPDIFVCAAKPEYDYIKKIYGHPEFVPKLLGFCRYDNLLKTPKSKTILLMPTWRIRIKDENEQQFLADEYFQTFNNLLNSSELNRILKQYGFKLYFYPHIEVQKFNHCFKTTSENIIICGFENYDVQKLLIDTDILITDFSSVFFDYAYMEKPVIYYQFDIKSYRENHYKEGYFNYEEHGFGPVIKDLDNLNKALEEIIINNSTVSKKYIARINEFFTLRDKNNCKRNFDAIQKLLKE